VDQEFERLVFFNTQCLNTLVDDIPQGAPVDEIDIKNHVPKIKATELLIALCQLFNQIIEYDDSNSTVLFISRKKLGSAPLVNDFRYKVSSKRILYKERRLFSLRYDYNQEDLDVAKYFGSLSDLTGINEGAKSTEINVKFNTLPTLDYGVINDTVAVSSLELNAENPFQFLFYRNFKIASQVSLPAAPEVPYVSCDLNYSPAPGYTLDSYELTWKGSNGLHEIWWKDYLSNLKMGKVFSVDLILKAKDLLNFDSKKRQSLGESVVIFEELKTTIKGNQLKVEGQVLRF